MPEKVRYVLDGGSLLHRIPWTRGSTFTAIIKSYADYVSRHNGEPIVVFDGYEQSSTKDMMHRHRSKGNKANRPIGSPFCIMRFVMMVVAVLVAVAGVAFAVIVVVVSYLPG